jgi:hypothetical protein
MKIIYMLLLLLTVWSCRQTSKESIKIIKVDPEKSDSVVLSKIALGVNKFTLETNDSSLITRVTEIETTNEYIFVNDAGRRVLQFDSKGKYIKQIGNQGRGPGEYINIYSIALDSVNMILYIDTYKKILCFDFSGKIVNVIKQESMPEFICVIGDKLWAVSTSLANKLENNRYLNITKLIRYALKGSRIDTMVIKRIALPGQAGTSNPQSYVISDLGNVQYLYYPVLLPESVLRDTIYVVNEDKLNPRIKLDFGNAAKPRNGKKQIFMRNVFQTNRYLFAEYIYESEQKLFCHDFSENISYNLKQGFSDDYFGTGKIQLKPLSLKNGKLYFVQEAFKVATKIEGVTENSNPVVFFVHLK